MAHWQHFISCGTRLALGNAAKKQRTRVYGWRFLLSCWYGSRGSAIMDRMLNRRTFLKTSAASLPLAAAIQTLNPATISAETIADAAISGTAPKLIPLPTRLAPVDPSTLPWQ